MRSAQGRGCGSPVRAAAVAGLALPAPLRRAWAAQGGRVVACSQAGSLDVQLRDVALGRARTVRWESPPGMYSVTLAGSQPASPMYTAEFAGDPSMQAQGIQHVPLHGKTSLSGAAT